MTMKLVAGTRGSVLALKQVEIVAAALKAVDASIEVEVKVIKTTGDQNQNPIPLDTIGKGWFTQEIEQELLNGGIDFAVHSLKDLTSELPKGLILAAYLPREDARDVLITKHNEGMQKLKIGAVIGTDSTRRQVQMLSMRPDVQMKSLRGNVPKRIEKLYAEDYDAIIIAAAGLKRLGLEDKVTRIFEVHEMTPAPGQGTLAVQIKEDNSSLKDLLAKINDPDASYASELERSFSREVGGGCKSPTGAYAFRSGDTWKILGMIATEDQKKVLREEMSAPKDKSANLGIELARKLLSKIHG
jgi:hydroxymethylbilane synthase